MEDRDVSKGFVLEEVRGPAPFGANPHDDLSVSRMLARATSDTASTSTSRRTTKSRKPIHRARWAAPEEFFLQPNEQHLSTVRVTKPVLLLVRAAWTGTTQGLKLAVEFQGARPVMGKATRVPPDRGTVLLTTRIETRGPIEVSIRNPDRRNGTSVQLIIGTMPLPAD